MIDGKQANLALTQKQLNDLVTCARAGDSEAEDRIFRYLLVRFRHFSARKVGDKHAVEDISQTACITVLEKYRTESFAVEFGAWAYGVLRLTMKKYLYQLAQAKNKSAVSITEDVLYKREAPAAESNIEASLVGCLMKVARTNRRYARVLNLSYQGYATGEICRKLDINRDHLYVLLNRARSMLWQCLQGETK